MEAFKDVLFEELAKKADELVSAEEEELDNEVEMLGLLRGLHERLAEIRAGTTTETSESAPGAADSTHCPRFHAEGRKVPHGSPL